MCHSVDNCDQTRHSGDHTLMVPVPTVIAEESHLPGHSRSLSVDVWTPASEDVRPCASIVIAVIV